MAECYESGWIGKGTAVDPYTPNVDGSRTGYAVHKFVARTFDPATGIALVEVVHGDATVPPGAPWSGSKAEAGPRWDLAGKGFVK